MDMGKGERRGAAVHGRNKAGETLAETLVTMLIVGLSSVLFATMVGAASRIFQGAKTKYGEVYQEIAAAEGQTGDSLVTGMDSIVIVVGSESGAVPKSVEVEWYGSQDYVMSYKVKK